MNSIAYGVNEVTSNLTAALLGIVAIVIAFTIINLYISIFINKKLKELLSLMKPETYYKTSNKGCHSGGGVKEGKQ